MSKVPNRKCRPVFPVTLRAQRLAHMVCSLKHPLSLREHRLAHTVCSPKQLTKKVLWFSHGEAREWPAGFIPPSLDTSKHFWIYHFFSEHNAQCFSHNTLALEKWVGPGLIFLMHILEKHKCNSSIVRGTLYSISCPWYVWVRNIVWMPPLCFSHGHPNAFSIPLSLFSNFIVCVEKKLA